ncbi:glycosyltransferase family 2 protein [Aestuariivirga sp.]|uniref:glycosyltransferase family 2 protein n=1 Tax=Aestuariivirga sp. TaxID=2650926 RepID=UPI0039E57ADD
MWPRRTRKHSTDLLAPFRAGASNDLVLDGNVWRATGPDPYIIYSLEKRANSGPLLVELDLEVLENRVAPRIYFHRRNGFSEDASQLMRQTGSGHYRLYAYVPKACKLLRFDPAEAPCAFRIRQFSVTKVTHATFAMRAMRNGANAGDEKPELRRLVKAIRHGMAHGVAFERTEQVQETSGAAGKYQTWIRRFDYSPADRGTYESQVAALADPPRFAVLMPVYNTPADLLDKAIQSVVDQIYPHWEFCIANDNSSAAWIRPQLDAWAARDKRIKVVHRKANGHIAEATNSAFALSTAPWIALLDHDDELRPHALAEMAITIAKRPDAQLLYSDEDKLDEKGERYDPYFKPDWNPDLFLSQNYLNHLTVHRRKNIEKAGGWRKVYNGSQDYDLNLRITSMIKPGTIVHVPQVLYHWRAAAESMANDESSKNYAIDNAIKALSSFAADNGIAASVEQIPDTNWYRLKYSLPKRVPLVSIIIPTKNGYDILKACIDSIREKTTYPKYEIIVVDNNSDDPVALSYFRELEQSGTARVLPYPHPFNYSAINNFAVKSAKGTYLALVNNDITVISPDWLTEMVSLAARPDTGCVGAKLYYPNNTIQHAGVIVGLGGVAGHSHKYFDRKAKGYFGRLRMVHNVTAVTAACLVVKKKIFNEVGGLDEENLKVAFNDVDFCMKVHRAGYYNVWTPFAELYHHEFDQPGCGRRPGKTGTVQKRDPVYEIEMGR